MEDDKHFAAWGALVEALSILRATPIPSHDAERSIKYNGDSDLPSVESHSDRESDRENDGENDYSSSGETDGETENEENTAESPGGGLPA